MDIHNWVFEKLKSNLPAKTSLAKAISQVLDLNITNCYKRLRGEVSLNAKGLMQLLIYFDISLDEYKGFSSKYHHTSRQRPDFIKDSKSCSVLK